MKKALITGLAGQDGSYLSELLLKKEYRIVGLVRKKESLANIKHLQKKIKLFEGDLRNKESLKEAISRFKPDEIYNLAAVSFIPASWNNSSLVGDVNGLGVARLLEIIRDYSPKTKFFQASSAQIFGRPKESPQNEKTKIAPLNPYAAAKAFGHFLIQSFREKYGLFACSAIFYNHESERRPVDFVTRRITHTAVKIKLGLEKKLELGNLNAKRDWGYALDYVRAAWLMLQQRKPEDFIIATGKLHSVKDICRMAFNRLDLKWQDYVVSKKELMRKEEAVKLVGDSSRARQVLGWGPKVSFEEMIKEMVLFDLETLSKK
jgi:GDPmannose 4,6-dehydratase